MCVYIYIYIYIHYICKGGTCKALRTRVCPSAGPFQSIIIMNNNNNDNNTNDLSLSIYIYIYMYISFMFNKHVLGLTASRRGQDKLFFLLIEMP